MIISEFSNNIQGPSKVYSFDYYHGLPGDTGAAAGFGTPTASATLLPAGSNPTASVTASGADTAKVFDFEFGIPAGGDVNVQADWNQTDTTADDYIKNKPAIPTQASSVASGDTGYTTGDQVYSFANTVTTELEERVDTLESSSADHGSRISTLETEMNTKADKSYVDEVKERVSELETDVSTLESSSADHGSRISDLETDVDQKANKTDTYTKTEVDSQLALKANAETTYTKNEVDALVESAKPADYEEVKERVTNLEYENRIVKAVIKKKIAEETEATGSVIQFPTSEGYPLADWGELKKLKGESVVWNQLVAGFEFTNPKIACNPTLPITSVENHIVFSYAEVKCGGGSYALLSGVTIGTEPTTSSTNWTVLESVQTVRSGGLIGLYPRVAFYGATDYSDCDVRQLWYVDLTQMFGSGNEPSSVTDPRIQWLKAYLAEHPEYDAGSLVDAQNVKVRSVGYPMLKGYIYQGVFSADGTSLSSREYYPCNAGDIVKIATDKPCPGGIRICFYDNNKNFIYEQTSSDLYEYAIYAQGNAKFFRFVLRNVDQLQGYGTKVTVNDELISLGILTIPSDWYTKAEALGYDLGMEGTVIDFNEKKVTWSCRKVDLGSRTDWEYGVYTSDTWSIRLGAKAILVAERYSITNWGTIGVGMIAYEPSAKVLIVNTGSSTSKPTGGLVYELATPVTKTFDELGIVIPPSWDGGKPWIRVEAGGTFTVVSTGAPAEATVSFLTDLGGNA